MRLLLRCVSVAMIPGLLVSNLLGDINIDLLIVA